MLEKMSKQTVFNPCESVAEKIIFEDYWAFTEFLLIKN